MVVRSAREETMQKVGKTLFFALIALALTSWAQAGAQTLKLRISAENPLAILDVQMAQKFAEILKEELGANFEYELFHTKALGDENVHLQMIRTGQIDVYPMGSDAVKLDPSLAVFDMPFLFKDRASVVQMLDGELEGDFRKSLRSKAGLELLAFGELGFRQIVNKVRPVKTPADLNGVKLRVPGSETRILAFRDLGAAPVTLNLGELYLALQQGAVDGLEAPLATIKNSSFHEVTKFLSISNHVYTPVTLVMNGRKFDSLTAQQQAAVKQAAKKAADFTRDLGAKADATLVAELGKSVQVNEIDYPAFQAASRPTWEKIGKIAGKDISEKVIAAGAK
jgi:tripartite ATP-independent transporter DctP family solute receptor